ncbi:MAG: exo-alpha-sialidase [Thermoflexibacter sp.]
MKQFYLLIYVLLFTSFVFAQEVVNNKRASSGKERMKAFQTHEKLLASSPYKNITWRLVGPNTRSGRSTDVWGIAGKPNIMYAAFATGGFWKTEDAGSSWIPLFDKQGTQAIGNFALAPSNPDIIYLGTGEANIFRASLAGMGIYKSTDGGKSWQYLGLENTGTIARIIVHPQNPDIVYVAASGNEWSYNSERGVYQSTNGGKSWQKILYVDEKTGCIDLVIDPSDANTLYASMWNRIRKRWSDPVPEDGDYIYKSTDGGKTWRIINKGLPDTKYTGRIGLAVAPSKPNVVYAFIDNHLEKRKPREGETDSYERPVEKIVIGAEVWKSEDKGESWTKQGEVHDFLTPFSGTYGWVFGQIRVLPTDANTIFVLGVQMAKSTDGGKTWNVLQPTDKESDWIHGDNHGLWIDPINPERMILGNDGGVSVTYNGGAKWKNFFDKIPTTQFYTITYDMQQPFNIFGSVQDEGSMGGSIENTFGKPQNPNVKAWDFTPGGEGTQICIDPIESNIVYSSSFYGRLMRSDMTKSRRNWSTRIHPPKASDEESHRGEWLAGTLLSPHDRKTVYHGMQYLFKSENQGDSWKRISPDLSYNNKQKFGKYPYLIYHQAITAIDESLLKKGLLYVGTDDGRVWLTENDGADWTEITKGLPYNAHVAKIQASRFNEARVYVALSDRREDNITPYIFVSEDNGKTWTNIGKKLPPAPTNVIIEDLDNEQVLYCGTDMGIYMSKDKGKTWVAIQANLPASVSVQDMFIHPRDKKLVIATYGRGVYVLDSLEVLK